MADYFVSGRDLPWWVIALSAVATYTDAGLAPAVTMLTYQGGLLGNAVWWIPYVIWMPSARCSGPSIGAGSAQSLPQSFLISGTAVELHTGIAASTPSS